MARQDRSPLCLDQTAAGGLRGEVWTHVSWGVVHDRAYCCGVLPHHQVNTYTTYSIKTHLRTSIANDLRLWISWYVALAYLANILWRASIPKNRGANKKKLNVINLKRQKFRNWLWDLWDTAVAWLSLIWCNFQCSWRRWPTWAVT